MVEKLKAVEHQRPGTPAELQAVQEGIRVLETLVAMGEEQNRKCDNLSSLAEVRPLLLVAFLLYGNVMFQLFILGLLL